MPIDELTKISIEAFDGDKILATKEINVFVSANDFQFGPTQIAYGQFPNQEAKIDFQVALQGKCRIHGERGFSNQAFYLSVNNQAFTEEIIEQEFDLGLYSVSASLKSGNTLYGYNSEYANFKIFINCPDANYSIEQLIETF